MIKTEASYQKTIKEINEKEKFISKEQNRFREMGLTEEQVQLAVQPLIAFHENLKEDLRTYEKAKKGIFEPISDINEIGKLLIGYRIYRRIGIAELAKKLGVADSQVSRDEKNEYYGSSIEKISNVMKVLEVDMKFIINLPHQDEKET